MSNVAIYPGTFDPITFGHIDVIKKSLKLFSKVIVAVSDGENKKYLFNVNERIEIVKKALFSDLKLNKKKIMVISFTSLTTDLCKKYKSNIILRGLRAVSDFINASCVGSTRAGLSSKKLFVSAVLYFSCTSTHFSYLHLLLLILFDFLYFDLILS
jgi:pantetheine-phosphate adenylyltransferase